NFDVQARDYTCYVLVRSIAENGDEISEITGPATTPVTVPAGGSVTVPADALWSAIQPSMSATDVVQFDVVVTRLHDEMRWFKQPLISREALPLSVSLPPSTTLAVGRTTTATITYANPLATPLTNATLIIGTDGGLGLDPSDEMISLGTIAAGGGGTIQ